MLKFLAHMVASLFSTLLMATVVGGIVTVLLFFHFSRDLPDLRKLATYDPPIVTRLYAGDGKLMAEYAVERRIYVPLSAMPKRLIQAFLSAEDKNFYTHTGVDFLGFSRAMASNACVLVAQYTGKNYCGRGGSGMQGGSTITQQVVKNFLLGNEKTFERKMKEAILAFRVSQVYSKDRILELYLNQIYLGQGSYGVAAAALNYFNKSMDELSVEEAAFLAAMPKAPANYDPRFHYDDAKDRRDWVIKRMLEDGFVNSDEAQAASAMPITIRTRDVADISRADFFAEEVRRQLATRYGSDILYKGGLYVRTTLEPVMQAAAEHALRQALVDYDRRHGYRGALARIAEMDNWQAQLLKLSSQDIPRFDGQRLAVVRQLTADKAALGFEDGSIGVIPLAEVKWARRQITRTSRGSEINKMSDVLAVGDVVIAAPVAGQKDTYGLHQIPEVNGAIVALDPHTGKVLAMAGGYSYGRTEFNRATQALRQPGSAFKPFVYLSALENGFNPTSMVLDAPVEMSQGEGMPMWRPENYKDEYLGPTTLRVGLEKSRNTITVRLAQMLGIDKVTEVAQRFGIYERAARHFAIVLGAQETTLLKLANAYAMLANGGRQVQPALIERIDDRNGKTIYRRDNRACDRCQIDGDMAVVESIPPLPADTRALVADPKVIYQVVYMMQGVVERGTATKAKVIGKPLAGKTGTTNDSRDAWFIGFSPDLVAGLYVGFDKPDTLGGKETGGSVALPGFVNFMQEALKETPAKPFHVPTGIRFMKVDLKTGQPPVYGEQLGPVIMEAFKSGEEPGAYPYDITSTSWENEDYMGQAPSEEQMGEEQYWQPVEDARRQAMWQQRYGSVNPSASPESMQVRQPPPVPMVGFGNRYDAPPENRRPVNVPQPDVGTGGIY